MYPLVMFMWETGDYGLTGMPYSEAVWSSPSNLINGERGTLHFVIPEFKVAAFNAITRAVQYVYTVTLSVPYSRVAGSSCSTPLSLLKITTIIT